MIKVNNYEAEILKYKERLNEMEFYKIRVEVKLFVVICTILLQFSETFYSFYMPEEILWYGIIPLSVCQR
jgi:hypothetical protein